MKSALGFDVSGIPSAEDINKAFGVDQAFQPLSAMEAEKFESSGNLSGIGEGIASFLADPGAQAPNRSKQESSRNDINLSGIIDVISSGGLQTQAAGDSTVNGHKAPGVDWRSKGGKNSGA
jgi:hypothetical protein